MNNCAFYGKIKDKIFEDNGTPTIEVIVEVMEVRKNRLKEKTINKENLRFKAWDSAAVAINTYGRVENYILISNAIARNDEKGVYFRINEFKVINEN